MKNLINKWLNPDLENALERLNKATNDALAITDQYSRAIKEIESLSKDLRDKEKCINELRSERDKLKEKVREQTEADVYLEASKILKRIESGEKVYKNDEAYKSMIRQAELLNELSRRNSGIGSLNARNVFGSIT